MSEKKNDFENEYIRLMEIEDLMCSYPIGDKTRDALQYALDCMVETMCAKGEGYWQVYSLYAMSMDDGNKYVNIPPMWFADVDKYTQYFLKYGIEDFTVSDNSTALMDIMWKCQKNGAYVVEMIEINTGDHSVGIYGENTTPAVLLSFDVKKWL